MARGKDFSKPVEPWPWAGAALSGLVSKIRRRLTPGHESGSDKDSQNPGGLNAWTVWCFGAILGANLRRLQPKKFRIAQLLRMKPQRLVSLLSFSLVFPGAAQESKLQTLQPVPIQQVQIDDAFWSPKLKVWRDVTIPDCFAKFEKDGALENFDKIRDGKGGGHGGPPWYDGLIYEMIGGTADFLAAKPDPKLEARLDAYIERIAAAAAKDPDGYLNTYTQLKEPTHRWGLNGGNDRWQHDLYNAGALVEAGVHYYRATGKTRLLEVAAKLANHMADVMGPSPKQNVIPGHALGEAALVNLYRLFKEQPQLKSRLSVPVEERRYLELAEFWIDARGHHEGRTNFGAYDQDEVPVLQQATIEGHAVRAMLLCCGLVAASEAADRSEYLTEAQRLWDNMVSRRMYVTGGVGAESNDEKFGPDYFLPNTGYAETCASVAAAFFHHAMNLASGEARYADEMERVLYNGVLGGVGAKGNCYFYENPLEAGKQRARWEWHGCPCCPPMFLKAMGGLPGYIYAQSSEGVFVNLYIGNSANLDINGTKVALRLATQYPWDGRIRLTVNPEHPIQFALNLRLPGWCENPGLRVNGQAMKDFKRLHGYASIERQWQRGDTVELILPMPVQRVHANPKVEADQGRVALQRGPIVYCLEGNDNNGSVGNLVISPETALTAEWRADMLGGVVVIRGKALSRHQADWTDGLHRSDPSQPEITNVDFTAIPYFANANRQPSEMMVWVAETPLTARPTTLADPATTNTSSAQQAVISVHADQILHRITPYLTGACIEDVNHEIYGGLDSQMIFGESFAEPAVQLPLKGFKTCEGRWTPLNDGSVQGVGSNGSKIIWDGPAWSEGEVRVEVKLTEATGGNGGLILKVSDAGTGADAFTGYEVSLERPGFLVVGRHRQNWEPLRRVPCEVPVNEWIKLAVHMSGRSLEVFVNGRSVTQFEDTEHSLAAGAVGLRIWQHRVSFRNFSVAGGATQQTIPFEYEAGDNPADRVSGMWRPVRQGAAHGIFSLESPGAFSGNQSQQIAFAGGSGVVGIENQGLNRRGMSFVKGKSYEGYLWARAKSDTELFVALESQDGSAVHAEKKLKLQAGDWQRLEFTLTPDAPDQAGRFAIKLKQPGAVTVGYSLLQPGSWGRFKNLPVRRDVAEGLIHQGVTLLRYGGSMVNNPEYRWKKMIGPRAHRPPYDGHWYPYASNGWGIFDFLNFCEAADFVGIPDLDINESPSDMADFMDYLNGTPDSKWGKQRAADGHAAPYRLKYLELGNEERVDDDYFEKFKAVAEVIWAKDPAIILIVGDFSYHQPIADPFNFTGADSGITTLAAHQKILRLARQHHREVWFDLHVWTDGPQPDITLPSLFSYIDALDKIADGAKHQVLVFELNANNHSQRRALANALAINAIQRDGRLPITCSANCLQPDGQNDNGWDQGLLFLNPSQVWLQPPGYVTQMISQNYQPLVVNSEIQNLTGRNLDVSATRSEDGRTLVLQVVNVGDQPIPANLSVGGFAPIRSVARVQTLAGSLSARNTASHRGIAPAQTNWKHRLKEGAASYTFPAHSFTVIRF